MDINLIPDMFQSKIRIAIISSLMTGEKTFKELKILTNGTDGNLSIHLSKLETTGYVKSKKDFFNNKPRTSYELTKNGKNEFVQYVNLLERIIKESGT